MKINNKLIKSLNAPVDLSNTFNEHYKEFNGDFSEFLNLQHISFDFKKWLFLNIVNNDIILKFVPPSKLYIEEKFVKESIDKVYATNERAYKIACNLYGIEIDNIDKDYQLDLMKRLVK